MIVRLFIRILHVTNHEENVNGIWEMAVPTMAINSNKSIQ